MVSSIRMEVHRDSQDSATILTFLQIEQKVSPTQLFFLIQLIQFLRRQRLVSFTPPFWRL